MAQLDQLLQKYEFENSHLSKAIATETDKQNIVSRQRRDVDKQTNEFGEKIKILQEEIAKTKVYEIEKNKGIERLKDEAFILRDHRNTIRVRLDKQKENNKQVINKTEEMIGKGAHKLEKYLEKYEGIPAAKKILEERGKREELENKIWKMKEQFLALKEKENGIKSIVDKQHFQVFKLDRSIRNSLTESSRFRKNAKSKYLEILEMQKLRENINKQTAKQVIQQQEDVNNSLQSKQLIASHSEQLQITKRIIILRENSQKDKNSQQQTEEMDTCTTTTSTPKITPIHMPNILLSPLNSLTPSNKSDTNTTQIPPKRATPVFTIPQLKSHKFPTLTQSKNPPNYEIPNTQRLKAPLQLETHYDTNTHNKDTNCDSPPDLSIYNTNISMDTGNQGQVDESEFRFGFLEEIQKSANPFGPMEFETINRTDSGFVTNLFQGSGTGTNQFQEADNPFSFVP